MNKKLVFTNNNLKDIIGWLKEGSILCLMTYNKKIFYYSTETTDELDDTTLIYVDISNHSSLMNEGEWPWYIEKEGFVEYKGNLPINPNNIYSLTIEY
jgi:hypothetical protein